MKRLGFWPCAVAGIPLFASEPSLAYYHPTAGRWVQRDPAGNLNLPSMYDYCLNRPTSVVDPMGLEALPLSPELQELYRGIGIDPAERNTTHGTPACIDGDCCDVLKAKLKLWLANAAQRAVELSVDSLGLKTKDPKGYNNHIRELEISINHIKRCFNMAVTQCANERKPQPPTPTLPSVPVRVPVPVPPVKPPSITDAVKIVVVAVPAAVVAARVLPAIGRLVEGVGAALGGIPAPALGPPVIIMIDPMIDQYRVPPRIDAPPPVQS